MPVQSTDIIQDNGPCIFIDPAGGPWTISASVLVLTEQGGAILAFEDGVVLSNYGSIQSGEGPSVVALAGKNNSVTNEKGADIRALAVDSNVALFMGAGSNLINHGTINGRVSILKPETSSGDTASAAIGLAADAPSLGLFFVNTGMMIGDVRSQGDAEDEIHNAGSIFGDVMLGDGNDLYDGRGGLMQGIVQGGGGADTITGGDHDEIFEGGGGRDLIRGGLGDDEINGGPGKDTLRGGVGGDNFIFADRGKADRVLDFSPGEDSLLLDNAVWKGARRRRRPQVICLQPRQ